MALIGQWFQESVITHESFLGRSEHCYKETLISIQKI